MLAHEWVRAITKTGSLPPADRAVETQCFAVAGFPLFDDEVKKVASVVGCSPATLKRIPAHPAMIWRRFNGPIPTIRRTLDIRLVAGLTHSSGAGFVERIEPAAWIAMDGDIYGRKHFLDSSNNTRKGGVRTACFIGEDASSVGQIEERFVAQCLEDFCAPGTRGRLASIHGYERLRIAHNGPSRDPRLPGFSYACGTGCDCRDDYAPDGNRRLPTPWRRLLHRAEQFLSEWELVRISVPDAWYGTGVRYGDLDGWPLGVPE